MIYEYKCECGNIENMSFMVKARPDTIICPKCNQVSTRLEVPSKIGISFKGGGFYSTDNNHKIEKDGK